MHVNRALRKITGWLVRGLRTLDFVNRFCWMSWNLVELQSVHCVLTTLQNLNGSPLTTIDMFFSLYGAHSALLPFSTAQDAARTHLHQNDVENCADQGDDDGVPGSGDACPGCGSDHAWPSRAGYGGKRRYRRGGVGAHFSALRSNKIVWVDCSPRRRCRCYAVASLPEQERRMNARASGVFEALQCPLQAECFFLSAPMLFATDGNRYIRRCV